MPEAHESSSAPPACPHGPLRAGGRLAMIGLVIIGVGMLVAPDSNLLGGLGPLGALLMTIGILVVVIGGLARLLPGNASTPRTADVADVRDLDERGEAASARRQP